MTKGKRRHLLAIVSNAGACWWCKRLLPGPRLVQFCGETHRLHWVRSQGQGFL
jgi:hypothetical protein